MPVRLPDGTEVPVHDERAQSLLRLKQSLRIVCHACSPSALSAGGVTVLSHEHGCPDAWQDETRECFECGGDFNPECRHQKLCGDCLAEYDQRDFDEALSPDL